MAKMKAHHKDMKDFDGWRWIQLFWMNNLDGQIAFSRSLEGFSLGFPSRMDDKKIPISDPWDERYVYLRWAHKLKANLGKYIIHGSSGIYIFKARSWI